MNRSLIAPLSVPDGLKQIVSFTMLSTCTEADATIGVFVKCAFAGFWNTLITTGPQDPFVNDTILHVCGSHSRTEPKFSASALMLAVAKFVLVATISAVKESLSKTSVL